MEIATLIAAYATLQISLVGGLWKLRSHMDGQFQELRESVAHVEVVQAGDREKNEGRWQLLHSAIEGNSERIDYRSQQLQERLRVLEKRIDKLEANS